MSGQQRHQKSVPLTSDMDFLITVATVEAPDDEPGAGEKDSVLGRFEALPRFSAVRVTFSVDSCSPWVLGMHDDSPSVDGV